MLLNCIPEDVINKRYKTMGQLTAWVILYVNSRPECFHRAVVNYLFNINDINCCYNENDFDGELYSKLKELKDGNNSALTDANILPSSKIGDNIANFCTSSAYYQKHQQFNSIRKGLTLFHQRFFNFHAALRSTFFPEMKVVA